MGADTLKCTLKTDHDGKGTVEGSGDNSSGGENTEKKYEKCF